MKIESTPIVTKQYLKDSIGEAAIIEYYLRVPIQSGLFKSPLRTDNNPTCSLYLNTAGEIRMKDFGNGFNGNFISIVMEKFGITYSQALKKIYQDMKGGKIPEVSSIPTLPTEKEYKQISVTLGTMETKDLNYWKQFGITPDILELYKVFKCEHVWINYQEDMYPHYSTSPRMPIYGYYFGTNRWKIYFPTKQSLRFLCNTDTIQGLKQLPDTGDLVIVTKSMKDVMSFRALGLWAIAPQGESNRLSAELVHNLKSRFTNVIINYDWDTAGKLSMIKVRNEYQLACVAISSYRKNQGYKDISDLIKGLGFEDAKKEVNKVLQLLKDNKLRTKSCKAIRYERESRSQINL